MFHILFAPILIPAIAGVLVLMTGSRVRGLRESITILASLLLLGVTIGLFREQIHLTLPWSGFGIDFSLRLYNFSAFGLLATAGFLVLDAIYASVFTADKPYTRQFYAYMLFAVAMTNGALLADNLVLLLFFWEGLLLALFGMIAVGNKNAFKTAVKMFIIVGVTDLVMLLGIGIVGWKAGTFEMSAIHLGLTDPLLQAAFCFLIVGAVSKAGAMPFHSWIPDAAADAPLPFMALIPASLEKVLGIYFLARICIDLFAFAPGTWLSTMLMILGAVTIVFAVMMALIQKDFKKLLSYHAISQVGYMILGIGTALPAGIIGGLFHMINHAMYKNALFLTGGAVEKQAGTTDLSRLGGLRAAMPVTFIVFVVAAASISGVPPFNGFFSKELVYDAALERGWIFYAAAALGTFLTAASFLKLGHAAFVGKPNPEHAKVKEAPLAMLVPMAVLALFCIGFGLFNAVPLGMFEGIVGPEKLDGATFGGFHVSPGLAIATVLVLIAAFWNHLIGVKRTGKGLGAVDHIHHAPVLHTVYEKSIFFDPYDLGLKIMNVVALGGWLVDRLVDWIQEKLAVYVAYVFADTLRGLHTGNYSLYLVWSLLGAAAVVAALVR